jgi:hypothetical protein
VDKHDNAPPHMATRNQHSYRAFKGSAVSFEVFNGLVQKVHQLVIRHANATLDLDVVNKVFALGVIFKWADHKLILNLLQKTGGRSLPKGVDLFYPIA